MIKFESYQPEAWFDDEGLVQWTSPSEHPHQPRIERRDQPWNIRIPRGLIGAGVLAATTVIFGNVTSAASSLDAVPIGEVRTTAFLEPPKEAVLSPLRAINRDFNSLFDSMRSGKKVAAAENMRALAKKAVEFRDEKVDVDSWARQLSDDVKDADD
jgi:hypothetical protein